LKGLRGWIGRSGLGQLTTASNRLVEQLGVQVMFCGYISDRQELLGQTACPLGGYPTDELVIAYAYRRWGRDLQAHVVGDFAAVVYEPATHEALLTHDALGLRPLFYRLKGDTIVFADEVLDLTEMDEEIDECYLADVLAIGFIASERTPYRGIQRLLPGHSLHWSRNRGLVRRVWNLASIQPMRYSSDEQYEEHFRSLLWDAVRSTLPSRGAVWVSLSGGLDSSTIAGVAADLKVPSLAAYSHICEEWPEADERRWMREVVTMHSLPWHQQDIAAVAPFAKLPTIPYGEPSAIAISERQLEVENELFAKHGVSVVLNGFGGDDILGRDSGRLPSHLADPLFDGQPLRALRELNEWRAGSMEQRSKTYWLVRGLLQPAADHLMGRRVRRRDQRFLYPPWIRPDYALRMKLTSRAERQVAPRCRYPGLQGVWTALWLQSIALATLPRSRMSYERRHPLAYRPLVEFMCAIPWEQKLRPRCDRYLQRRALKGVLPELVRRRATKGSGSPAMVEYLRRSPDWVDYLCESPALASHGVVEVEAWRNMVRNASVGQTIDDRFFMAGVMVEVWLKQFEQRRAALGADTTQRQVLQ
jgi:asparagine synthase (glutamine-hydrolysing)